jgi:Cys-tRNA(Pro)/Cys-tRNA(Cys) deacylase
MLAKQKVTHQVHTYDHGAGQAYGPEAAERLGLDPERVFKTLVAEVDGALTVGVVPVSATLDLKALAGAVGGKRARMADVAAAERATGYVAGGISPLGQRKRLPTVIDESAQKWETVFCSGGRRGLEIELAPADLSRLCGAEFAPIAS